MYYVIETNRSDEFDGRYFTIMVVPAEDRYGEPIVEGEFGTTIGIYKYAHGAYKTLDEARNAVKELCGGEYRSRDQYGEKYRLYNIYNTDRLYNTEVESYKPGRYHPINEEGTSNLMAYSNLHELVKPWSSDEDLKEAFNKLNDEVKKATGFCYDERTAIYCLEEYRKKAIKEWTLDFIEDNDLKSLVSAEHTDEDLERVLNNLENMVNEKYHVPLDRGEVLDHLYDCRDELNEDKELERDYGFEP